MWISILCFYFFFVQFTQMSVSDDSNPELCHSWALCWATVQLQYVCCNCQAASYYRQQVSPTPSVSTVQHSAWSDSWNLKYLVMKRIEVQYTQCSHWKSRPEFNSCFWCLFINSNSNLISILSICDKWHWTSLGVDEEICRRLVVDKKHSPMSFVLYTQDLRRFDWDWCLSCCYNDCARVV